MWLFIAQLVEHYSANAEAMGSNPEHFFGLSLRLLKSQLQLRWSHFHFIRMSAVHIILYTNHISRYICRQKPKNGSLLHIGQFKERNAEPEWAAVSWRGALRDDPNNGCEGDYLADCVKKIMIALKSVPQEQRDYISSFNQSIGEEWPNPNPNSHILLEANLILGQVLVAKF